MYTVRAREREGKDGDCRRLSRRWSSVARSFRGEGVRAGCQKQGGKGTDGLMRDLEERKRCDGKEMVWTGRRRICDLAAGRTPVSDLVRLGLARIRGLVSICATQMMLNGGATSLKGSSTVVSADATIGKLKRHAAEVGGREGGTCSHDWEGRVFGAGKG